MFLLIYELLSLRLAAVWDTLVGFRNQSLQKTSKKNHKAMEIFRELPIRAFKKIPPKVSLDAGRVGG